MQDDLNLSSNLSSGNKYLSVTTIINAESKDQLDTIYQELNNHELVLMTL
jgi:putative lipoic acid-binding regulatory protein